MPVHARSTSHLRPSTGGARYLWGGALTPSTGITQVLGWGFVPARGALAPGGRFLGGTGVSWGPGLYLRKRFGAGGGSPVFI